MKRHSKLAVLAIFAIPVTLVGVDRAVKPYCCGSLLRNKMVRLPSGV